MLAAPFEFSIGIGAVTAVWILIVDHVRTKDTVREDCTVLGRFGHLFSKLGAFFAQYLRAKNREEMTFNRAHRNWIDAATRGADNMIVFGSPRTSRNPAQCCS